MSSFHRMTRTTALPVLVNVSTTAQDITGADSTLVFPVMSRWSAECGAKSGIRDAYLSVG